MLKKHYCDLCHLMPMQDSLLQTTFSIEVYVLVGPICVELKGGITYSKVIFYLSSIETCSLPKAWIFQLSIVLHNGTIQCWDILSRYIPT